MRFIKRLYYKIFTRYRWARVRYVNDELARAIIIESPDGYRWERLPENDRPGTPVEGWTFVGFKERITE